TRYKASTASTRKHIKARLDEGFTIDDFKMVIDKKCSEWLNNSKMEQYLRPETLFGTKFEGYLNAKNKVNVGANGVAIRPPEPDEDDSWFPMVSTSNNGE
ncbi:MAG: conserved phage C-terminal domain-containing protein, partial [Sutterella sp.]|nr:conserved phage C-terminal domain-containing protein [Sutterella sp.]